MLPRQIRSCATKAFIAMLAFCVGCESQAPKNPSAATQHSVPAGKSPIDRKKGLIPEVAKPDDNDSKAVEKTIDLVELNWTELQSLIAEHKSKVVIVDVWSTACEPCMKEFPHLIALQKAHPVDVVTISFDVDYAGIKNKPVAYYRERVLKFLESMGDSAVRHRMCTVPADELFTEIKLDSIPAVYVYDRNGQLAKLFHGSSDGNEGVSYETQVAPFVETLIKASESATDAK